MTREARPGRVTEVPVEGASYFGWRKHPEASADSERSHGEAKRVESGRRETVPSDWARKTVPQTDTGRRDEQSKAHERTRVKELGKMRT
jgi:hypothetical protein